MARMRIGFLSDTDITNLDWAKENGFGSIAWHRFETSGAGPGQKDWRILAESFAAAAKQRNLRISTIGALYKNPLDPEQSEHARTTFLRPIDGAAPLCMSAFSRL